jgi:hypothetical protein
VAASAVAEEGAKTLEVQPSSPSLSPSDSD